jgi:RHS repeat-associated protein
VANNAVRPNPPSSFHGQVAGMRRYSSVGDLIATRDASGVTWTLVGKHRTTSTVSRERYLPFGQRCGMDDLPFAERGFLGKAEDASADLTYLGARYYDPAIAKFISTDPELDLRTPEWVQRLLWCLGAHQNYKSDALQTM